MTTKRPYLRLIQAAGMKHGLRFDEIEADQVYKVINPATNEHFFMYNVDLGLNDSSSFHIAKSKASTYAVLAASDVPAVKHVFLLNPRSKYNQEDSFHKADILFGKFNSSVVVKRDDGAQGQHVFKTADREEMVHHLNSIFDLGLDASISPYYDAELEYRVVVLNEEVKLIFSKNKVDSWKHNLSQGALAGQVDKEVEKNLSAIAVQAAKSIGLHFCSVDILDTPRGLFVLEVNSTVFLSEYMKGSEERKTIVSSIFEEAFKRKFNLK